MYDVIVVGSGPAGYTAATYAVRAGLDTLVIEGSHPGGALTVAGEVDNFPGFSQPVPGPALARALRAQARRFGAELVPGVVVGMELTAEVKAVTTAEGVSRAPAVILAMGSTHRPLDVPGARDLTGRGVSTSAKRDGDAFAGREVAVVGGGDAAVEEALFLATRARRVTVIHHRPRLRAAPAVYEQLRGQDNVVLLPSSAVAAVLGRHSVTGVRVRNVRTGTHRELGVSAVFVAIGQVPCSELLLGAVDLDARGHVVTVGSTHTSLDGVFAAGDLIDGRYRQAVTAAASGCRAALDAGRWLGGVHHPGECR